MSNHRAIATVTAALRSILQEVANRTVGGAEVTVKRPDARGEAQKDQAGINVFLYRANVNATFRNIDVPTRGGNGRLIERPQTAFDLEYLLTFYGPGYEPHLLLGQTLSALHAEPTLSAGRIQEGVSAARESKGGADLQKSDLAEQLERVKFTSVPLTFEEISKLWSAFPQVPYDLSIAYQASAVLIEADLTPQKALPVRGSGVSSPPGGLPQIEQLTPQTVEHDWGEPIVLRGKNLAGDGSGVRFGDRPALQPAEGNAKGELLTRLPSDVPAGVIPVQVVHRWKTPTGDAQSLASGAVPLVVRPKVRDAVTAKIDTSGDKPVVTHVAFQLTPAVQPGQRGTLLLNQADTKTPTGLAFDFRVAVPADGSAPPPPQTKFEIPVRNVDPHAAYLVRVSIDGAESSLIFDEKEDKYVGPRLEAAVPSPVNDD